jgi:AcrR family transcriptional regulator
MGTRKKKARPRAPLTRDGVLQAALALADQGGIPSLSMRKLGEELGVEAMALYHHFANKDDLLDGLIDLVFSEVALPHGSDWRSAMRARALSLRDALARHRWAIGMMESRVNAGAANLRHHDAMIGSLRAAGFDIHEVAHIYSLLDSYIYGFALTKMRLPFESADEVAAVAEQMLTPATLAAYPHLVEMITEHALQPGYDYGSEFERGLDVILGGLPH